MDTGCTAGERELRSKFAGESGSKASMLIVRQLRVAMARGGVGRGGVGADRKGD